MKKLFIIQFYLPLHFSIKVIKFPMTSYAIETTTEKYSNVLIDSVYGLWVRWFMIEI